MGLGMTSILAMSTIAPAYADGAAGFRNVLIGAGAVFGITQMNHNKHQKQVNQGLYNDGRLGTFWYDNMRVNCRIEHGSKACYKQNKGHWEYVPNG